MRIGLFSFLVLAAHTVGAQTRAGTPRMVPASVSGVVRDSIARGTLAGAVVQLVSADSAVQYARTVVSDSIGRFTIDSVPNGRFALGFYHPMLDSLGVEAPLREVVVSSARLVRADLAIPSAARLRTAICGAPPRTLAGTADPGGVVIGIVRDARTGAAAEGVRVTGEWLEFTFRAGGVDRRRPRLVTSTKDNGWFALCNVPSDGVMYVAASRGADSTDLIELQVPAEGFLRHELFLGASLTSRVSEPATARDSTPRARVTRRGEGRLAGTVVALVGGQPLAGAQISVADGPLTRANERGEFTLTDAPLGSRVVEIRAVGYYPTRKTVNILPNAPPMQFALATLKSVLETVRVTAARVADRHDSGFDARKRSSAGRFLTADDITRRGSIVMSDLFRTIPGLTVDGYSDPERRLLMKSAFGDPCSPAIFINSLFLPDLTVDAIEFMVDPKAVMGMEVYTETTVPAEFQRALSGCGSVVIWTK